MLPRITRRPSNRKFAVRRAEGFAGYVTICWISDPRSPPSMAQKGCRAAGETLAEWMTQAAFCGRAASG